MEKTSYMTEKEAIDYMKKSIDVHDWNDRRDTVKRLIDPVQSRKILAEIDAKGLIVIVLKGKKVQSPKDPDAGHLKSHDDDPEYYDEMADTKGNENGSN